MKNQSPFQYRVFKDAYRNAGEEMCSDCKGFIPQGSKILDFGCGSGIIGKEFGREFDAEILGVDIIDNRVEDIPFRKFDGNNLSFLPDGSYDVVMINYVLHHAKNPLALLKEAQRVTKSIIIIYENLPEGIISKVACRLHGISFAWLFQKNDVTGRFFTKKQWEDIFRNMGLAVVFSKRVSGRFNPMKEQLFILKK
jgi:ubiquinone/menaquinone biosynthesis C-methylase UbiE